MDKYSGVETVFLALADPTRRAVVERLGEGPASVTTLAEPFDMALPSFLKHVRVLEDSGCIRTLKRGRVRMCTLERGRLDQIDGWLGEQRAIWAGRTSRLERLAVELEEQS